jgi:protein-disulfide isomerase
MPSRPTPAHKPSKKARTRLWVVGGAIAVFLALVGLAQLLDKPADPVTTSGGTAAPSSSPAGPVELPIVRRAEGDPMAVGKVDAPVVMVMWTDMRCPFCAVFNRDTLPKLMDEYVDAGKVRIEVHDVAFFGEQSENAAVAARAAGAQGKFHEYLQAVYAVAPEGRHPKLPRAKLVDFAEQVDVPDIARFKADLDSQPLHEEQRLSTSAAQGLGVSSVPFFVVGQDSIAGAQPIEVFREFLDGALTEAQ